jgi:small subunit ribosomal protein S16
MAIKIRLARGGAKKSPFYRIVVANADSPRDGKFLEKIGTYNPLLAKDHAERLVLKKDRADYWLGQGANPTEVVAKFLDISGVELPGAIKKKMEIKKANRVARPPRKEEKSA